MRRPGTLSSFVIGGTALLGLLALPACNDFNTGQDPEPPGQLLVERLMLNDGQGTVTDTSAPLDCTLPELKNSTACVNGPFKDQFSQKNAPPNVDSATKLRVVFNKIPLKLNGVDVETAPNDGLPKDLSDLQLKDPNVLKLECDACTGIPASYNSLQVTGSDLSPDPHVFDYGPGLQMEVLSALPSFLNIADDVLRALEPGTTYRVVLNPGLSGRNAADKVLLDARALALLTFTTAPFAVKGIVTDVVDDVSMEPVATANNRAISIDLNAGVDPSLLRNTIMPHTATAKITGTIGGATVTDQNVDVVVSVAMDAGGAVGCDGGNQRTLYVAPASGTWISNIADGDDVTLTVTLVGTDIRDIAQDPAHTPGMGRHTLRSDVTVTVKVNNTVKTSESTVPAADVLACL